jgi:hypothetical protein
MLGSVVDYGSATAFSSEKISVPDARTITLQPLRKHVAHD